MRWPTFEHVIFDFDSTLTTIEGVDVLAQHPAIKADVEALTSQAMDGSMTLEEVYAKRLQTIQPTRGAVRSLRDIYKKHLTEDAATVVDALQHLGHSVYIVSGGLLDPIAEVGIALGIPREHIFAVDIEYDQLAGEWWTNAGTAERFATEKFLRHRQSALQTTDGKAGIIDTLMDGKQGNSLLIGDGITDLNAGSSVELFLAYAGTVSRSKVVNEAPVTLHSASLAPVLILAAGRSVGKRLRQPKHKALYEKALSLIQGQALAFRDPALGAKFEQGLRRSTSNEGSVEQ